MGQPRLRLHPMRGAPRCCLFKPHLTSRISDWAQKDSLQRISCASQLRHEATALSNVLYGGASGKLTKAANGPETVHCPNFLTPVDNGE